MLWFPNLCVYEYISEKQSMYICRCVHTVDPAVCRCVHVHLYGIQYMSYVYSCMYVCMYVMSCHVM